MTTGKMREMAEAVIRDHIQDIEFLSVCEMVADMTAHPDNGDMNDSEYEEVCANVEELIRDAYVSITWEDQ